METTGEPVTGDESSGAGAELPGAGVVGAPAASETGSTVPAAFATPFPAVSATTGAACEAKYESISELGCGTDTPGAGELPEGIGGAVAATGLSVAAAATLDTTLCAVPVTEPPVLGAAAAGAPEPEEAGAAEEEAGSVLSAAVGTGPKNRGGARRRTLGQRPKSSAGQGGLSPTKGSS